MTRCDATAETLDHLGRNLGWSCPQCRRGTLHPVVADRRVHSYCERCTWDCCETIARIEYNGYWP
jgi:uncharacterized protein (DUF983 family)